MTPHKQMFRHAPERGEYGDCDRTTIACLLDLRPVEVPHWGHPDVVPKDKWNEAKTKWLAAKGYSLANFLFGEETGLENILMTMKNINPGLFYLLSGESATGVNHVVVCLNDKIVHDPSLDNSGIVGPCDDGYFWVQFLVPANQVNRGA